MDLTELQAQVEAFDRARDWHRVAPAHIGLHLLEELGEIARELLRREGYKGGEGHLDQELADLLILIAKLANSLGVNLGQAVSDKLAELEERFPLEEARAAIQHYDTVQKGTDED